jgi:colanic acid/amylovoran biosynthesis protein
LRMSRLLAGAVARRLGARRASRAIAGKVSYILDAYEAADIVMTSGGTFMVQRYKPHTRFVDHAVVYLLRRPLVFFTQGFEPVDKRLDRALMRAVLSRAALVIARGETSAEVARQLGARRVEVAADAGFALAAQPHRERHQPPVDVIISVREWPYATGGAEAQSRYENAIGRLVMHIVAAGGRVRFLSTCQGAHTYRFDDSAIASRIVEALPRSASESVVVDREFHRWDEIRDLLSAADLVVATRLHAAVLALCTAVPVLPIGYESKTHEVFEDLGLADLVVDLEDVTPQLLIDAYRALVDDLPRVAAQIAERVPQVRADALSAAEPIRALLQG